MKTFAWIVLVVSLLYLTDRLLIWIMGRSIGAYRRRHARRSTARDRTRPDPDA
jgi:hypothetical protein